MTRVLILAAGQGSRLRPLTNDTPKCLVPLLGIPLLERQIAVLKQCGINDIHIAAGYHANQVQLLGYPVTVNPYFLTTNMVETLFSCKQFLEKKGDLIISYGDIIYQKDALKKLLAMDAEIALVVDKQWRQYWELRRDDPLEDAETLILDKQENILELGKKTKNYNCIQGQYIGLIKIRADKIADLITFYYALDRTRRYDGHEFCQMYMTSLLQLLIDANWEIKAVSVNNGWLEIDTMDDLLLYEELGAKGQLKQWCEWE